MEKRHFSWLTSIVSFKLSLQVAGNLTNFEFHDAAGKEDVENIRENFLPKIDVAMFCYDVNDRDSFKKLETFWHPKLAKINPSWKIVFVGLKTEKRNQQITDAEVNKMKQNLSACDAVKCSSHDQFHDELDLVSKKVHEACFHWCVSKKRRASSIIFLILSDLWNLLLFQYLQLLLWITNQALSSAWLGPLSKMIKIK